MRDPPPVLAVGRVVTVPVDRLGALVPEGGEGPLRTGVVDPPPAGVIGGALVVDLDGVCTVVATLGFLGEAAFFTTLGVAGVRAGCFALAGFGLAAGFFAGMGAAVGGAGVDRAAVAGACCALFSGVGGSAWLALPPSAVAAANATAIASTPSTSARRRRLGA